MCDELCINIQTGRNAGGGGGGGGLRYFHTYLWLGPFSGVRKNDYLWGYEEIVDILGGHYKGLIWGTISIHFWAFFLKARYRMGIFFLGGGISNIYLGMPDCPDIFIG